jgi:hypothetical protein
MSEAGGRRAAKIVGVTAAHQSTQVRSPQNMSPRSGR